MHYDELISRLRNGTRLPMIQALMNEAADAIEELSKDRGKWKATAQEERDAYRHWFDQYQKDVPRWIPVTEDAAPGAAEGGNMNLTMDYAALKRGLSRRIKQAKKDGDSYLIISVDFASNILIALEHISFIARADKEVQT